MNAHLSVSIVFACLVTWSHGRALRMALAHRSDYEPERRKSWNRHLAINGVLWLILFADIITLQFILPRQDLQMFARAVGLVLVLCGIVLVTWVRVLLGRDQAMGKRFFFPETTHKVLGGPFRFVRNPMYVGFILVLVGLGLALGIYGDFILAAASFVLLNLLLARIENRGL